MDPLGGFCNQNLYSYKFLCDDGTTRDGTSVPCRQAVEFLTILPELPVSFFMLLLELALRHPPSLFSHLAPVLKLYRIIFYKCNLILDVSCKFVLVSEMYICNFSGVSCFWSI